MARATRQAIVGATTDRNELRLISVKNLYYAYKPSIGDRGRAKLHPLLLFFLSLSLFSPPLLRTMKFLFIKTNVKRDNVQLRAELKFLWIYERFLAFFSPPLFPFSLSFSPRASNFYPGWNRFMKFFFYNNGLCSRCSPIQRSLYAPLTRKGFAGKVTRILEGFFYLYNTHFLS